ncbi:cytidylate kinase-like family protein [uncultured Sunxiuqinia sp.]|uniref:cytidylate kinase-like family protein n=1 Tax=uncultured Sunxiuqinia sp. TaxID=1573825 RepID=UPI002AA7A93D|nr:cytidylate kinase-like family protein [uncultured Sunxiuqinia sp.]
MKNFLSNFLLESSAQEKKAKYPGPVIMISRECGCSAKRIAIKLSKILTGYSFHSETKTDVQWKWVSKEIIEEAAQELEMEPGKIKDVFLSEAKTSLHEVSTAFSTEKVYDADDQQVIDTVCNVILRIAEVGNFIIVGRAAGAIAHDVSQKLSIKLQAPLDWRINRIMQVSNMSRSDAQHYVLEIDRQRELFVEHVSGAKMNNHDFDLIFNYSTMKDDYIVDAIINIMKNKRMIVNHDNE